MRATQRVIVGAGLALVGIVAVAMLIAGTRWLGPDPSERPATQASGPHGPLADVPSGPPEPIAAAEDTSVGTLPPPPDASLTTQLVSRDLLAPAAPATPQAEAPTDSRELRARTAPGAKKSTGASDPADPGFTVTRDGWTWGDWDGPGGWGDPGSWYDADRDDDCRRGDRDGHDHGDDCDDRDRRD